MQLTNLRTRESPASAQPRTDSGVVLDVRDLKTSFPIRHGFFSRVGNWAKAVDEVGFVVRRGKALGLGGAIQHYGGNLS